MDSFESRKNLFEVNNARTQSVDEVVQTFVPPDSFWRLVSAKNHIILGSRGSGKTAVIRMLAHDHLSRFEHREARRLIERKELVGIYVPMRAEWVGTLKNKPWQTEAEKEAWFQWRLNISCCSAFLETAESCVRSYIAYEPDRLLAAKELAKSISADWSANNYIASSLVELKRYLEDVEWSRQVFVSMRAGGESYANLPERPGIPFEVELFAPLRRAIAHLRRILQFPDSTIWTLCLDEIEFLDSTHHRILNSHLRSSSDNLCFKLTTMPYFHHTLETNTGASLTHGHDFEYVYLDFDPSTHGTDRSGWIEWAERILDRKVRYSSGNKEDEFDLSYFLGERSPLVDEKGGDWNASTMKLFKRYATPETYDRAIRLYGSSAFRDQISRKLQAVLLLRSTVEQATGNARHELYSGPKLAVLCSDANPRQLIRLFNELTFRNPVPLARRGGGYSADIYRPTLRQQTKIIIDYSREALSFSASEEEVGDRLFRLMDVVGNYFRNRFYNEPLSTDYYYAIRVTKKVDDEIWKLIRYAVGLGLLFPKVGFTKPELLPVKTGEFNLAFRLAPAFSLLPRRGKSIPLDVILNSSIGTTSKKKLVSHQYSIFSSLENNE